MDKTSSGFNEKTFRVLFEESPQPKALVSKEGKWLLLNNAYARFLGYTKEELLGKTFKDITHPDDRGLDAEGWKKLLDGEITQLEREKRYLHKNGDIVWGLATVTLLNESGNVTAVNIQDINNKKKLEEQLKQKNESLYYISKAGFALSESLDYEKTLKSLSDILIDGLADWCVIDLFDGKDIHLGALSHKDKNLIKVAKEMRGKYPPRLGDDDGAALVLKTGEPILYPKIPQDKIENPPRGDEDYIDFIRQLGLHSAIVAPLKLRGKTIGAITLISADSKRSYNQNDLEVAQEVGARAAIAIENARHYRKAEDETKLREEFISIASHELNNSLASISLKMELMKEEALSGEVTKKELGEQCGLLINQTEGMCDLIENLLNVSKINAGTFVIEKREEDLAELSQKIVREYVEVAKKNESVLTYSGPNKLPLRMDASKIGQVIINLVLNAIKHASKSKIDVCLEQKGNHALLKVKDNGPGIPSKQAKHIFERFNRAGKEHSPNGLGLGLYLSKSITEKHGGSIDLQTAEGVGSTFIICLPME